MARARPPKKRARYHHGDLRAQLAEATRQLVEAKGPDHFSVSEACRAAGVSTAAPYKHFKDKDEMLQEVALLGMERQHRQMLDEMAPHPQGSLDRIVALGRVYIRFATTEPGVFRLMFGLSDSHDENAALVEMSEKTYGLLQGAVAECRGHSTPDDEDLRRSFLLWSFVHGISFLRIDAKMAAAEMPADLEATLRDVTTRIMRDTPC